MLHVRNVIFLAAIAYWIPAFALDEAEIASRVKNDLATEYAECGAYFAVVAEGMRRSLPEGPAKERDLAAWKKFSSGAFQLATALRSEERTIAVAKQATEQIKRLINNSYENLNLAADEYGHRCKVLIEDPKARTQQLIDKEHATSR